MLSADENNAGGTSGERNRNPEQPRAKAGQRRRKSGQDQNREPDQLQATPEPVIAPTIASDPTDSTPAYTAPAVPADETHTAPVSYQALANAYGDYTRRSFEQTKSFFEKLGGARSFDTALELHVDFAKQAWNTFIADSQRIRALHRGLGKEALASLEGVVAKMTDTALLPRATRS